MLVGSSYVLRGKEALSRRVRTIPSKIKTTVQNTGPRVQAVLSLVDKKWWDSMWAILICREAAYTTI